MATLIAPERFSPVEDAKALNKACKGWGTNEKGIISILGNRTAPQRDQIRQAYHELFQEDLVKRLESELSGDFEMDPADRDAVLAHVALTESGDYHVIVEIACIRHPEELLLVRRAYQARYKCSLEEDVAYHTSGDVRKLLVALVSTFRYEGEEINGGLANKEAGILHKAIKDKKFNRDEVIRIVTTRSRVQLMATFNCSKDDRGRDGSLRDVSLLRVNPIRKTFIPVLQKLLGDGDEGKDFLGILRTTIRCLMDPKQYFENIIRNAIKRLGTDEDALSHVIVTHLEDAVAKETSGDYKVFLLTLLGKQD